MLEKFRRAVGLESKDSLVAARKLLYSHGHLKQGDPLPFTLGNELMEGVLKLEELESLCSTVEEARGKSRHLSRDTFRKILKYGLRNLKRVHLEYALLRNAVAHNIDFGDAALHSSEFRNVDFAGSNFEGIHVHDMPYFTDSLLHRAKIGSIRVERARVDLEQGSYILKDDDGWNILKTELNEPGSCSDCEHWNKEIMDPDSPTHQRGIVLFQEGHPLGHMKLKGEPTFLAMRTVRNAKGDVVFWKGMVYALEIPIVDTLDTWSRKFMNSKNWRRVDVENVQKDLSERGSPDPRLARVNLRFIEYAQMYGALDKVREDIESGKVLCDDIYPGSEKPEEGDRAAA